MRFSTHNSRRERPWCSGLADIRSRTSIGPSAASKVKDAAISAAASSSIVVAGSCALWAWAWWRGPLATRKRASAVSTAPAVASTRHSTRRWSKVVGSAAA